jgi:hypothetical protein
VVNGLLLVMDDYANPRVQAHAGAALVNFSEDCPKSIIGQYLDPIIGKLEQVLSAKFREVRILLLQILVNSYALPSYMFFMIVSVEYLLPCIIWE